MTSTHSSLLGSDKGKPTMTTQYDCLVLIGYRNAGKDSLYKLLAEDFDVYNAKFGEMNKRLACDAIGVSLQAAEVKEARERQINDLYGLTLLDVIDALYHGSKENERYLNAIVNYTLAKAKVDGKFPVFTDIRRPQEMLALKNRMNPFVVKIIRPGVPPSATDNQIMDACTIVPYISLFNDEQKLDLVYQLLLRRMTDAGIELQPHRPIVYICSSISDARRAKQIECKDLPVYEPLLDLYNSVAEVTDKYELFETATDTAFQALVPFLNDKCTVISRVSSTSYMLYNHVNHESFLPKIREQATIKYVGKLPAFHQFTKEEVQEYATV